MTIRLEDGSRLPNWVVLLKKPLELSEETCSDMAKRAWPLWHPATDSIVSTPPWFMIKFDDKYWFELYSYDNRFFPKGQEPPKELFPQKELRDAIKQHNGWISIDITYDPPDEMVANGHMAKLVAEFTRLGGLAVLFPPARGAVKLTLEACNCLRSEAPSTAFKLHGSHIHSLE